MIPSPIEAEALRWATPTAPLVTAMPIMATPSQATCARSPSGMASSIREPMTRGWAAVSDEMTMIVMSTISICTLYALAYDRTRRMRARST